MNNKELKILCLEDNEEDAIIIREQLKGEGLIFQFEHVLCEEEYTEKLRSGKYNIILSDYHLPGFSGIAALLLAKELCPDIPFICVSGIIGEDLAVELMQLGASDYIMKDRLSRLRVAIESALRDSEIKKARIKADEEIKNMKGSLEKLNQHLIEVREIERALISREIHDQLGQLLTALKIDTEWLRKKSNEDTEERAKLEGMIGMITDLSRDVQRIAFELRPPILDDLGLASAMEWYIREFEKRTGINCSLKLDDVQFPDGGKNLTLYRILQEALTNVARHSKAKNVIIIHKSNKNGIVLEVTDDGIGLEEKIINSYKSLGFVGIRERLKQHNGNIDIKSILKKGTKLIITIPFN